MKPASPALHRRFHLALLAAALTTAPGCGLIFGGDQTVDNKSHDYSVVRLDRDTGHDWRLLTPETRSSGPSSDPGDTGDVAFEHRSTGSIISVDSVCHDYRGATLDELTHYLLLGLKTEGPVVTQPTEVDSVNALDSTVLASMSRRAPSSGKTGEELPVRVRAVVLRKSGCTYDLMFISNPKTFDSDLPAFDRFLKGFHAH